MVTREEILDWQRRTDALRATPLGAAYFKFKNAYQRALTMDVEDSLTDKNRQSTQRAWDEANEADRVFRELLECACNISTPASTTSSPSLS